MKQTRAGVRGASERTKSSSSGLSGSIENPPPPIATICPLEADIAWCALYSSARFLHSQPPHADANLLEALLGFFGRLLDLFHLLLEVIEVLFHVRESARTDRFASSFLTP